MKISTYGALKLIILLVVPTPFCLGQLTTVNSCTGTLGQPQLAQSFGSTSLAPLAKGYTTYKYVSGGCPNDGEYTVAKKLYASCYKNTWHTIERDHTSSEDQGNMMIVNASWEAGGVFYEQTLTNLKPNQTYELSLWVVNIFNPLSVHTCSTTDVWDPDIIMLATTQSGLILQTSQTGSIVRHNTPTWVRYAITFTTPSNGEPTIIKLQNNGRGGCGNDLAIDDIQVSPCIHELHVWSPDVFSPNDDNVNDIFSVSMDQVTEFGLTIFDRWGSVIFYTQSTATRWNGTFRGWPCSQGLYPWVLCCSDPITKNYTEYKGQVLLVR